jgi:hypothetical protein
MAKLHVNHESMPEDIEIDVPPYGLFKNGHVYEVEALDEDTVVGSLEELDGEAEEDPNPGWREVPPVVEQPEIPTGGTIPSDDLHDPATDDDVDLDDEEGDQ